MTATAGDVRMASVMVVVGTRPEAIKLAPVVQALRGTGLAVRICLSGQHPDLAGAALADFGLAADRLLSACRPGQSLAELGARALSQLAAAMTRDRPRVVVVQGDTTTALAAALAARAGGRLVAHVEAGLRTFDIAAPFPEELNRVAIARVANLHFAPTPGARANLIAEGVAPRDIEVTGNTIVDAVFWLGMRKAAPQRARAPYILVTAHRREDRERRFAALASALRRLVSSHEIGVRFVVHPGVEPELLQQIAAIARVELLEPMSHAAFIAELAGARLAVTDSGGIQEEASVLGVPTLVVRAATERPEVLADGAVQLVGEDALRIERAAAAILADPAPHAKRYAAASAIGDGKASVRIARRVARALMCCRDQSSLAGADCSCT